MTSQGHPRSNVMVPTHSPYKFVLVLNNNIWPNSALLRNISLQNLRAIEVDLSRSLRQNLIIPLDSHIWFPIAV